VTRTQSAPRFELLTAQLDVEAFSCEEESLNRFLRERALRDMRSKTSATRVLLLDSPSEIVGYYTLSAASIPFDRVPRALIKKLTRYPTHPATLLARLARDARWRGKGMGELLVVDAIRRAYTQTAHVGSTFIIVDAVNDRAVKLYQSLGFTSFDDTPSQLFMPMSTVEHLFR
jgi:ribosomal protein S18 acetylase RimI-like enzyme